MFNIKLTQFFMIYDTCFVHFLVIILVAFFVCLLVCYCFYYTAHSYWLYLSYVASCDGVFLSGRPPL